MPGSLFDDPGTRQFFVRELIDRQARKAVTSEPSAITEAIVLIDEQLRVARVGHAGRVVGVDGVRAHRAVQLDGEIVVGVDAVAAFFDTGRGVVRRR